MLDFSRSIRIQRAQRFDREIYVRISKVYRHGRPLENRIDELTDQFRVGTPYRKLNGHVSGATEMNRDYKQEARARALHPSRLTDAAAGRLLDPRDQGVGRGV